MPSIANCPACNEKIAVSQGVVESALVRCPLCQAEFAFSALNATAVEVPAALALADVAPAPEESQAAAAEAEAATGSDVPDAGETQALTQPEDSLPDEAEALRSKAQTFQTSAGASADEPEAFQPEADALETEAQSLLAKAGLLDCEAREAEAQARIVAAKADSFKKSAGSALETLAEALEAVAETLDARRAALTAELDAATAGPEEPTEEQAGESEASAEPADADADVFSFLTQADRGTKEEPEAAGEEEPQTDEPEEPKADGGKVDMFAFLAGADREVEEQPETASDAEEPPAPEPELPVKETDMFAFLAQVDEAVVPEPEAEADEGEDRLLPEEPESPAAEGEPSDQEADVGEAVTSADEEAPAELSAAVEEVAEEPVAEEPLPPSEAEAPAAGEEPAPIDAEAALSDSERPEESEIPIDASETVAAETKPAGVDVEALQARIEKLAAVAGALKAKAAEIRTQARGLRGEPDEGEAEEVAEESGWAGAWQPVGAMPAIDIGDAGGAGAFSFGEGAAARPAAPGRTIRPGRKRKEKSLIGELIGIVLGGAAGLTIAYYGLNIFGGARYNFAKLYLPGVSHTVKHRPPWWPTWARFEGDDSSAEAAPEGTSPDEAALVEPPAMTKPRRPSPPKAAPKPPARPKSVPPKAPAPKPSEPTPTKNVAETAPPPAAPRGYVDLKNRPSYTADELGKALKAAHGAFGCPKCNSTGQVTQGNGQAVCPDCQGHPPESLTPAAYPVFCRLGEVLAFVDPAAPGAQLDARKTAVRDLTEKLGKKPQNVLEVGQLAVSLLDDPQRKSPGIFFAGTVQQTESKGQLHAATVKFAGIDRTIKVISKGPQDLQIKDRVMVLGCLVKNNSGNGNGSDAASPFVWSGAVVKFAK